MSKNSTRREREKLRHRNEILGAAEAIFADKGFHRCTMEEVAKKAEFSVGTIYNLFSSKDLLYRCLIEQRCCELRDQVKTTLDIVNDPLQQIKAYIDLKIKLCYQYVNFVTLYTRERLGDRFSNHVIWRETVAPIYKDALGQITNAFRAGIEQGTFRPELDPADLTIALEGLTDGFMYEWLTSAEDFSFINKQEAITQIFFDGVCQV